MDRIIAAIVAGIASTIVAFIASGVFSGYFVKEKTKDIQSNFEALPSWETLYSHTETGASLEGDIEKLIAAVRKGYDIKIIHRYSDSTETVIPADLIQVNDKIVSAQNVTNVSWWRDKETKELYFPEEPHEVFVLLDTKGNYHAFRRDAATGGKKQVTKDKSSLTWLGNVPNSVTKK